MINIKAFIIGNDGVGKTALNVAIRTNTFPTEDLPSVFDTSSHYAEINGKKYMIALWDSAGGDDYDKFRPMNYPDTQLFLVCFSVVDRQSFERVTSKWIPEIANQSPGTPFVLVGTKIDLREDEKVISELSGKNEKVISSEEGDKKAKEIGAVHYLECSALTQKGLKDALDQIVKITGSKSKNKKDCIIS
eukprot:TRINITY_DN12762_c0_g1_i1.p1 TRINITY_DN12762_c0_g1~~TRINITY_DN12762_c0_g1_i1.p1  ORF type:complete len:190 (+),score=56.31 TRINITY_DN12762_c0_g1_i1:48-617(+)